MPNSPPALPTLWSPGSTIVLGQVITWSLLDWLVLALPLDEGIQVLTILALAGAQYATLAGWLALGDGSVIVRATFAVHGIFWTELINPTVVPFGIAILFASLFCITWTAPLALWRLRGWSCRLPSDNPSGPLRQWQFSIWHVLVLMTLVAAALGAWRLVPVLHPAVIPTSTIIALILGILAWTQWIVLLRPKLTRALPITVAATLLSWISGIVAITRTIGGAEDVMLFWTGLIVIHTFIQGVNLLILRANGYRLLHQSDR